MKFDDAERYFLDFEGDLPNEAGGIPIGMYVAWLAGRKLLAAELMQKIAARHGQGKGWADLFFEFCDGKLVADDLNETGLAFTQHYYDRYIRDYVAALGITDDSVDGLCSVQESRENLSKVARVLDKRWVEWRVAANSAAPATPQPPKATGESVLADLNELVVPEMLADGFAVQSARYDGLMLARRIGGVDQHVRFGIVDSKGVVSVFYRFRFGCSRLRKVWLALLDPAYRENPPAAYAGDASKYPDLDADENSLTPFGQLLPEYNRRFKDQPRYRAQVTLAMYRERFKPVLDGASNARALAEIAQTEWQMTRQRHHLGYILGVELLSRITLFAAYTDWLRGPGLAQTRAEMLRQHEAGGVWRRPGEFPERADIERVLDTVVKPGFAEKASAFLDNGTT